MASIVNQLIDVSCNGVTNYTTWDSMVVKLPYVSPTERQIKTTAFLGVAVVI